MPNPGWRRTEDGGSAGAEKKRPARVEEVKHKNREYQVRIDWWGHSKPGRPVEMLASRGVAKKEWQDPSRTGNVAAG